MKILVTGGAGYVGSHIVKKLIDNNYSVVVYDNLSEGHREAVDKKAVFVNADLCDIKKISSSIKKYRINAVIHMAAFALVEESMKNPEKYFTNNVDNGINLLEAMRSNNVNPIVFSSSSVVYGKKPKMPLPENSRLKPENPYGETKLAFEEILKKSDKSGIKSISLRYFNAAGAEPGGCIGEDHKPETHLIPNVLNVASGKKDSLNVYGTDYNTKDGTAVRDYIHVSDLAEAHILALEALFGGHKTDVYNLGNEKGYSVLDIIKMSEQVTGKKIPVETKPRRAGDAPVAVSDCTKIKKELKWKPKYSDIKDIIGTAWNWHRNHPDGYGK